MALCPKCGADNVEGAKFCTECGAPLLVAEALGAEPQPAYTPPENPYTEPQPAYTPPENPYGAAQFNPPVQRPTGGLIAWSIISILLCMIPGIVALIQALSINSAPTAEAQQQKISSAKLWCTIATVLGVLAIVFNIISIIFYGADARSFIGG